MTLHGISLDYTDYLNFVAKIRSGEFKIFEHVTIKGTKYPRTVVRYTFEINGDNYKITTHPVKQKLILYAKRKGYMEVKRG